ncbi:hypothetical protein Ciccas_005424 [Cichlidogyrus casuarinus]|uniref:Uncharacterized protein n=1 Tax=Cichlidogyrus casuarinus TaxID=1844966 RepID=A0ABD2Q8W9_9PLAT
MTDPKTSFYAGFLSGLSTRFFVQPFDVAKIRIQVQSEPLAPGAYYSSFRHCLGRIYMEEGLAGLFRGHSTAQMLSISYTATQFFVYENAKKHSIPTTLSAYLAGFVAVFVSQPIDMIRTRLISQGDPKFYSGFPDAVRKIVTNEGFFALWRGINANLLLTPLQTASTFTVYTELSKIESPISYPTVNGAVSGIVSKSIVYPLDLARKRMEVVGFEEGRKKFGKPIESLAPKRFSSLKDMFPKKALVNCLVDLFRTEGIRGIYKGYVPSLAKAATSTGLTFTFYEIFIQLLPNFVD